MKIADVTTEIESKAQRPQARAEVQVAAVEKSTPPARQTPAAPPVEVHRIESVTRQIDSFLRSMNRSLHFQLDDSSGRMVVTIRDSETGEVIRQVPGEDALRIAQSLQNRLSGIVDEKV